MADMLSIGSTALLAYRTSLSTISNNIANANTPGYTRERADLSALEGQSSPFGQVGSGVQVTTVQRLASSFLQTQLSNDTSGQGRVDVFQTYLTQIDSSLSDAATGLAAPLQGFFDAMNGVAAYPTSSAARQVLLQSAQTLSSALGDKQQELDGLNTQVSTDIAGTVSEINSYTSQIATLNQQIEKLRSQLGTQPPNDLLDQRDLLVQKLSADIGVSTSSNPNGSINVYAASGQALVLDTNSSPLTVQKDVFGSNDAVVFSLPGGLKSDITSQISGGKLGGLLDLRREVLTPAIDQVGRIAVTLSQAVNAQHELGMDLQGQLGGPFFSTPTLPVTASTQNTGAETVSSATVVSPNGLGTSDYQLQFSGGSWTMTDQATGAQVALTATVSGNTTTLVGAGMSIDIDTTNGLPQNGDKFLVQPTRYAAGQLNVLITDPSKIAAANPVQSFATVSNSGNATITQPQVVDITDPNLLTTSTIQFIDPNNYTINGGAPQAYTSGTPIVLNGVQFTISGTPAAGDTFTIKATGPNSSDNSNAVKLAAIASQKLIGGGASTLADANGILVGAVGSQAQQATAELAAQTALVNSDTAARNSISGVNLDEEAASLTQFQQAYQAAAQVISTSNSLFQSLLGALHS